MRIGFDITQAVKKHGRGIHRYVHEILPAFAKVHPNWSTTLCIRGARWWQKNLVADLIPSATRRWMPLDTWVNPRGLDHFHSFGNHLPAWSSLSRSFTIHDFRAVDFPAELNASKQRLTRNIQRADAIRPFILYHYGGVYVDMDTFCLKNFDNVFQKKGVYVLKNHTFGYTNFMMASSRKHPFWKKYIDKN